MWFASAILRIGLVTVRQEIPVSEKQLAEFCAKWQIAELRVLGSVLRDDFRPDSDLDKAILESAEPYFVAR